MSDCSTKVIMPITEYEMMKEDKKYFEKRYYDIFDEINKHLDVNENGEIIKYNETQLLEWLKNFVYEVKYDL